MRNCGHMPKCETKVECAVASACFAKKILVVVEGGVAYAVEETIPAGHSLEIIDRDNLAEGPYDIKKLSPIAKAYYEATR